MGVRGLTTYIEDNSKLYLKPHELRDCYLVIDGNNISSHLYKWMSQADSAFGGDYDEYYDTVRHFFSMLQKCGVTPIVMFDGGYEKRKLKTVLSRNFQKILVLRKFSRGYSNADFFPLLMKNTFLDVMEDLGVLCVQCDLEADVEIATVARVLNCPVLSYDSDFYIYDVQYIPFASVCRKPLRDANDRYYVSCCMYDVANLLRGVDKSLLPILATLLGNDYIESSTFQKFFGHVIMPKNKNKSYTQNKIHGVLHWLRKENVESATKLILSHLEKKVSQKVQHLINSSIQEYTNASVSESVLDELSKGLGDIKLDKRDSSINLPPDIIKHFTQCRINKFIVDMLLLQVYFTSLQIEDVYNQSSHLPSLQLIRAIYSILGPYVKVPSKPLKLYLTVKNHYSAVKVERDSSFNNLAEILKESRQVRLELLYKIVGVDNEDVSFLSNCDVWIVFIISYIYWVNKLKSSVSCAHIHALILMVVANQIVQKSVGYFRNHSKFVKKKGPLLTKLKETELVVGESEDFHELLESVTMYECLLLQKALLPLRQTTEKARGKAYCVSVIHTFNAFQSCLFHVMQLNALLNHPLPHLKVSDFYSGTLLFNFYLSIKGKADVDRFGWNLLKDTPNLAKIYSYLSEKLVKYFGRMPEKQQSRKKTTRKNRIREIQEISEEEEIILCTEEEGDEYDDENNPYSLLQKAGI